VAKPHAGAGMPPFAAGAVVSLDLASSLRGRASGAESLDCDKLPLFPVRMKPASGDAMIISRLSVDSDISPRVELREVSERER
jgi:hypothetical protein